MRSSYGHFDAGRREYVITNPETPEPWINYLDDDGHLGAFVSNGAGGAAWYGQPHTGRLTRYRLTGLPMDTPGFYVYLREGDRLWSPSYFPTMTPLAFWECRHGAGYTRFIACHAGIEAVLTLFMPRQEGVLLWDLKLTNTTATTRELVVYPYLDYSLHDVSKDVYAFHVCGNQARYVRDAETGDLMSDYFAFEATFPGKTLFGADVPFASFDMDRNRFMGRGRTEANPSGLAEGLHNSEIPDGGFFACGVFALPVVLEPGQPVRRIMHFAAGTDLDRLRAVCNRYRSPTAVDTAFAAHSHRWEGQFARLQVQTPDEDFDVMLNTWFPITIRATCRNGRSISHRHAGGGSSLRFRDTMQDIMPAALYDPETARRTILLLMRCVTASGRVVTGLDPHTLQDTNPAHTRIDAIVWGVFSVYKYLAETGDRRLLDICTPCYDKGEATVLDHLIRGMRFVADHLGVHGLPQLFDCDWNDMLKVFSAARTGGETVMVAQQYIVAAQQLIEMLRWHGRAADTAYFTEQIHAFTRVLDSDVCWDGAWFTRLLYPDGIVGGRQNREGRIFLNTQSWAALAGTLPDAKVRQALDSVAGCLDTPHGIRLFAPPFTTLLDGVTPFHTNTPGAGENGGLFLHANTWAVMAEARNGNAERAWKYFRQILPNRMSAADPDHYAREPYAFASWVYGPDHVAFGHAALTWLTGGAAWMQMAATEWLLGVRPGLAGLRIAPCIPSAWRRYGMTRHWRGTTWDITVENPGHRSTGCVHLTVDGIPVEGDTLVPVDRAYVKVQATLDAPRACGKAACLY